MSESIVGVLTGDIVKSQQIAVGNYDEMLYALESTLRMLVEKSKVKFDIFRGDSFQVAFPNVEDVIEGALIIRLALKINTPSIHVRQSIGIGTVSSQRHNAKSSTGEAYVLSGNGLDQMKSQQLVVNSNSHAFQSRMSLMTKLVDALVGGLTLIQSEALLQFLIAQDKSHSEIASSLNKTRSNTTKLLIASHYQLISEYIEYFQKTVKEEFAL